MALSKADQGRLAFEPYLRELADRLHLKDWTVEVAPDPPDADDLCHVVLTYGRKYAVVRLSDGFLVQTPEEQRQSLTHELIHCHLDPAGRTALDNLSEPLQAVYRRLMEYAVDGLADAVAPLLPLPLTGVALVKTVSDSPAFAPQKTKTAPRTGTRGK